MSGKVKQIITIGNAFEDAELIEAILKYKENSKLKSGAETVRDLCRYALEVKKVK